MNMRCLCLEMRQGKYGKIVLFDLNLLPTSVSIFPLNHQQSSKEKNNETHLSKWQTIRYIAFGCKMAYFLFVFAIPQFSFLLSARFYSTSQNVMNNTEHKAESNAVCMISKEW